jgi:hypothetical protein
MDDGSAIIATFGYANGAPDPVQVGLRGCRTVSNSRLARTASSPTGAALVSRLERLLQPAVRRTRARARSLRYPCRPRAKTRPRGVV